MLALQFREVVDESVQYVRDGECVDELQPTERLVVEVVLVAGGGLFDGRDGLPLGSNVDEALPGDNVWTKTVPEGWTIDDSGVPGVVDPDEWDDQDHADGLLNSYLVTPEIDITDVEPGTLELTFDSSWRREDTQTATITVSYDGGEPIMVSLWESEGADTGFVKDDADSETVTVLPDNPDGAQTAIVAFGMIDAGNDWWWAIDNVVVAGVPVQ